jgi:hypothetical protein
LPVEFQEIEDDQDDKRLRLRTLVCHASGRREAMKSVRGCLGKAELDLHTLTWTRGGGFPITSLEARLKCPMCGSRKVSVIFDVPSVPAATRIAGMPSG